MEWTDDLIIEFLELYETEPHIWNPKDPKNKNRNNVHDSWKRIEMAMNGKFNVAELKKKKESLMATYRKLYQRVEGSSGKFKPDWFAYAYMNRFLNGVYIPFNNPNNENKSKKPDKKMLNSEESDYFRRQEYLFFDVADEDDLNNDNDSEISSTNEGCVKRSRQGKKRRYDNDKKIDQEVGAEIDVFQDTLNTATILRDNCAIYSELLANKLRALDENTRELAMLEIDHLLYRFKQNMLKKLPLNSLHVCTGLASFIPQN